MSTSKSALVSAVLVLGMVHAAGAQEVGQALRQQAIDNCSGDAMRLCPNAIFDETAVVSCMSTKRADLTRSCRVVYDRVAQVLRQ